MKRVFQNCKWIGAKEEYSSPIIRKNFSLNSVISARIHITGLGFFYAEINSKPITDECFLPIVSDYEFRDLTKFIYPLNDMITNRIYYHTYDITSLLNEGENLLTVQLGNGFYRQQERICEGKINYSDTLKTIFKIVVETESGMFEIVSDGSETQTDSFVTYNNLFYGETVDYTHTLEKEKTVMVLPDTDSEITESIGIADKTIRKINPSLIFSDGKRHVFDAKENISGVAVVKTSAEKGSEVVIRFAEEIDIEFNLNFNSTGANCKNAEGKPQIMEDRFITDGEIRIFKPKFVWHAFRYFEVIGKFDEVTVEVIHSDTPKTAEFKSDFNGMNFLFDAYTRTQLNNMHGSYPMDCPHRERLGYTGDGQICATAAMMMLDCRNFYQKWIQDILDGQNKLNGHVQHTAPFMGGGGGTGGWGSAIINVPYAYYKQYGEIEMLKKCYEPMRKWISYLKTRCENFLVICEEEGGWCLGDWCTLEPCIIPPEFVNSCCFIKNLLVLQEIAEILGFEEHIVSYKELQNNIKNSIYNKFYNPKDGHFCDGVQGADAFAVWSGIAGEETAKLVDGKYAKMGHFDTGFIGTDILLEVLFEYGYSNTAIKLLENEEFGSFLYMKNKGATTLWETWKYGSFEKYPSSMNHPMFGGCSRHLFTGVLGIKQQKDSAGFNSVLINPSPIPKNKNIKGTIFTPKGKISIELDTNNSQNIANIYAPKEIKILFAESDFYNFNYNGMALEC